MWKSSSFKIVAFCSCTANNYSIGGGIGGDSAIVKRGIFFLIKICIDRVPESRNSGGIFKVDSFYKDLRDTTGFMDEEGDDVTSFLAAIVFFKGGPMPRMPELCSKTVAFWACMAHTGGGIGGDSAIVKRGIFFLLKICIDRIPESRNSVGIFKVDPFYKDLRDTTGFMDEEGDDVTSFLAPIVFFKGGPMPRMPELCSKIVAFWACMAHAGGGIGGDSAIVKRGMPFNVKIRMDHSYEDSVDRDVSFSKNSELVDSEGSESSRNSGGSVESGSDAGNSTDSGGSEEGSQDDGSSGGISGGSGGGNSGGRSGGSGHNFGPGGGWGRNGDIMDFRKVLLIHILSHNLLSDAELVTFRLMFNCFDILAEIMQATQGQQQQDANGSESGGDSESSSSDNSGSSNASSDSE